MKAHLPDRPRPSRAAVTTLAPLAFALFASGFTGGSCAGPVDEARPLPRPVPPPACRALDEAACAARGDCTASYAQACACPGCLPGAECPPCECEDDPTFTGCYPNDPCAGLDEAACAADPFCEAIHIDVGCPPIACPEDDPECVLPECPPSSYFECRPRQAPPVCEPVACRLYCEHGFATDERGCEVCACNPEPPPPPTCEPVACTLYCEHGFATDERGCEVCACSPAPNGCAGLPEAACERRPECNPRYTFDECASPCEDPDEPCPAICEVRYEYEGCFPTEAGCEDDADCPNGYCEHFASCAALDCPPPPPSVCVEPGCDDGRPILCDAIPPTCAPGEVAAARGGCWACVDARTCR